MKQAGLVQDAVYLVRPDGYIAFATVTDQSEQLNRYFLKR